MSSWAIALLPIGAMIVNVWLFSLGGQETTWLVVALVLLVTTLASYGLARADQRGLRELGLVLATAPSIALFCPTLYLFIRGSRAWRETTTGFSPAWLNVAVILTVMGMIAELPVVITVLNGLSAALE